MKFTYYTIIGRDPELLDGHFDNVVNYAGFNKLTCDKELLLIIYKNSFIDTSVTEKIIKLSKKYFANYVIYEEPQENNFIQNLYACWNLGYQHAKGEYIFRGGSDQIFSKDSFVHLYNETINLGKTKNKFILQANTIENEKRIKELNTYSRHFVKNFGDSYKNFDYASFENFIEDINIGINKNILTIEDCLDHWGKPTAINTLLGRINRVDGCSWLMKKQDWIKFGPLPSIKQKGPFGGVTGDVAIHDILQINGYEQFIVKNCVTYHFVQGESLNIQGGFNI